MTRVLLVHAVTFSLGVGCVCVCVSLCVYVCVCVCVCVCVRATVCLSEETEIRLQCSCHTRRHQPVSASVSFINQPCGGPSLFCSPAFCLYYVLLYSVLVWGSIPLFYYFLYILLRFAAGFCMYVVTMIDSLILCLCLGGVFICVNAFCFHILETMLAIKVKVLTTSQAATHAHTHTHTHTHTLYNLYGRYGRHSCGKVLRSCR